jgi:arabinose-5-phosphate isomerase
VHWAKKLYLRVSDITKANQKPEVSLTTDIKKVIVEISEKMLGVTAVTKDNKIVGIITDGDLRRMLAKTDNFEALTAQDIMSESPKTIDNDAMAVDAMDVLETNGISQLLAEENGTYSGVVHLHNLIREGII